MINKHQIILKIKWVEKSFLYFPKKTKPPAVSPPPPLPSFPFYIHTEYMLIHKHNPPYLDCCCVHLMLLCGFAFKKF